MEYTDDQIKIYRQVIREAEEFIVDYTRMLAKIEEEGDISGTVCIQKREGYIQQITTYRKQSDFYRNKLKKGKGEIKNEGVFRGRHL